MASTGNGTDRCTRPRLRRHALLITALSVVAAGAIVVLPAAPVSAATITVDSAADTPPGDGACTLRAAITNANNDDQSGSTDCASGAGSDTITFDIAGAGPHTVNVLSELPAITGPVTIDGYTQAGSSQNALASGSDAILRVGIHGINLASGSGLVVAAPGTVIRGLVITGFDGSAGSAGVVLDAPATLEGNFIGVKANGETASGNLYGVLVDNAADVVVGGTSPASRNVISGNADDGVFIQGTSTDTVVQGNVIGTDRTGTAAVPNLSGVCTCAQQGSGAMVVDNLLSGNAAAGVYVASDETTIVGNLIGTDIDGSSALPNGRGGVVSGFASAGTAIGDGTVAGRNVISGNLSEGGVSLGSSSELGTTIRGNYIGVGADGTTPIGNVRGIWVFTPSATNITIGGNAAGDGNIIANSATNGVQLDAGTGTRVVGNSIYANADAGIVLAGGGANDVGDPDTGVNRGQNTPTIARAASSGGGLVVDYHIDSTVAASAYPIQIDIYVADSEASGQGRTFIGRTSAAVPGTGTVDLGETSVLPGDLLVATATDANGNSSPFSAVATARAAVTVNSTGDEPADPLASSCETEVGNGVCTLRAALETVGAFSTIAFDIAGGGAHTITPMTPLPAVTAPGVTIDGTTQGGSTCISWPPTLNIEIDASALSDAPFVLGTGPSAGDGLIVRGLAIGGTAGSTSALSFGAVSGGRVECNFLGTNRAGTATTTSTAPTIEFEPGTGGGSLSIGGPVSNQRNLIVGRGAPIAYDCTTAITTGNLIAFNYINTDPFGAELAPGIPGDSGVEMGCSGLIEGNRIAFTGPFGISVGDGASVAVRGNSIFGTGTSGIVGPPTLPPAPVLQAIEVSPGSTRAVGALATGLPGTRTFAIDLYANSTCANTGDQYLGAFDVTTDPTGTAAFDATLPATALGYGVFTATATDVTSSTGATSRFSACATVTRPTNKLIGTAPPALPGFGYDIDVDGDVAVIGETTGGFGSGRVTVYTRDPATGTWSFSQLLGADSSRFGSHVAIEGDYIAVTRDDLVSPATLIYIRQGTNPLYTLAASLPDTGDVDISEGLLLLGDPDGRNDAGIPNAKVFDLTGNLVDLENRLLQVFWPHGNGVPQIVPTYGDAVAISYDRATDSGSVAIGAPGSGTVYTFTKATPDPAWVADPVDLLTSPDGAGGEFGVSVAISPEALVVGERLNDVPAADGGAAWVYPGTSAELGEPQKLVASDTTSGNVFGGATAIDGDVLVVGAPAAEETNVPYRAGAAYVFERAGATWAERQILRAEDDADGDQFGWAVALSGDNALIGAPFDDNENGVDAGAVYAYDVAQPPALTFDLGLAVGSPAEVAIAPTGIAVNRFDRNIVEGRGTGSATVAASSITTIGPEDTALASVRLGDTPLSAIVIDSDTLSAIPLVNIDIEGGWSRVIAGSALEQVPLVNLTFGDVLRSGTAADQTSPAGRVAGTPLSAIDVEGTPLSAIPLSAIALGSTPLSAIPLSAIGTDPNPWCAVIESIEPECDPAVLGQLTVMEVTLRGVPLSAIPLSAIPLSAIDLDASPLSAIPLSAIDLGVSPLSAIPLSAIPLSAIDAAAAPLSAIPLSAIPLSAIPLSAIDLAGSPLSAIPLSAIGPAGTPLSAIPTSIPLSAIPLSAIDVNGAPLSAIEVEGAPLSAIPLSAIVLADTPLSAIPLSAIGDTEWCAVLAAQSFNCGSGVSPATTTLRELSVRGVPLSAIPLSAIPLSAIDVQGAPLSAIPLSAIPLSAIPLSAIPLSAIDVDASPLSAIPLSAIPLSAIDVDASPLSAIPLSAIPLSAIPLSAIPLSAIPLSAIPLSAIPLSAIDVQGSPLSAIPLSAIDVIGSPLSAIPLSAIPLSAIGVDCTRVDCGRGTLGDAIRAGAIPGTTTLVEIQGATGGIRLGELAPFFRTVGIVDLQAGLAGAGTTLADLTSLDDLVLGDLPDTLAVFDQVLLGALGTGLVGVTFDDLIGRLRDPATGALLTGAEQAIRDAIDSRGEPSATSPTSATSPSANCSTVARRCGSPT